MDILYNFTILMLIKIEKKHVFNINQGCFLLLKLRITRSGLFVILQGHPNVTPHGTVLDL